MTATKADRERAMRYIAGTTERPDILEWIDNGKLPTGWYHDSSAVTLAEEFAAVRREGIYEGYDLGWTAGRGKD